MPSVAGRFYQEPSAPCQVYIEVDIAALDVVRFWNTVKAVVARHPILRARLSDSMELVIDNGALSAPV